MVSSSPPSLRRSFFFLSAVLLLASLITGLRLNLAAHPAEDAAMLMRYSAHLSQGHGIVWNIGEKPVDGATDFLFMLILAGLNKLGLPLEAAAIGLGLAAHLLTVALVFWTVARVESGNLWLASLSALLLALGPGVALTNAYFGTTTFALAGALTWHWAARLARVQHPPRWLTLLFSLSCLLTGLIRPEGVFLALLILNGLLIRRQGYNARTILRDVALVFGGLGLVYFLWRWQYFGYPLPNPFYKKGAGLFHPEALWASFRFLFELNQPFFWLLAGSLIALLIKWLPSLRGSPLFLPLDQKKLRRNLFLLSFMVFLGVALGFTRQSQPQPGMLFERYSPFYFTLLILVLFTALVLLVLALTLHRWMPARLRLPWFSSRLAGQPRNWALQAGFVLIPVLGFTLIWVLLSNEMNVLGRFQYPLVPLILMASPALLAQTANRLRGWVAPHRRWLRGGFGLAMAAALIAAGIPSTPTAFPDGRYDVGVYLRQYSAKGYTIATSEAGLLPFYSTWRAIDTWGLNDQWITHTGEITDAYLDRYHPELIVFHANLQFTEKDPVNAWDWMVRRLWGYAKSRGYVLAAAFGSQQDDYHYYYVRSDFVDAPAIIAHLRSIPYPWHEDGLIAVNHAPNQP